MPTPNRHPASISLYEIWVRLWRRGYPLYCAENRGSRGTYTTTLSRLVDGKWVSCNINGRLTDQLATHGSELSSIWTSLKFHKEMTKDEFLDLLF